MEEKALSPFLCLPFQKVFVMRGGLCTIKIIALLIIHTVNSGWIVDCFFPEADFNELSPINKRIYSHYPHNDFRLLMFRFKIACQHAGTLSRG